MIDKTQTFTISKKERHQLDTLRHMARREGKLPDLKTLILRANKYYGNRTCVVERVHGEPVAHTDRELKEKIDDVGTALLSLGLRGSHIAILGESSFNWILSFFAIVCGVGVAVPLDKELSDEDLSRLLDKADCDAVFCTQAYFKTIKKHMASRPDFRYCFTMNKSCAGDKFISVDELIDKGRALVNAGETGYIDSVIDNTALAAIFFTSGTTGANKGVMLSHKNLVTNVEGILSTIPTEYSSFSVLPMNHAYELSCNVFTSLYMDAIIYINDSLKNISNNLTGFKPEAMGVVPMIIEGIYNGILSTAKEQGKGEALAKLVGISNKLRAHGIDMRGVFFSSIQKKFCDRKFPTVCCGGAPSKADYMTGMGDFGFRIYNGYGLTEASPSVTLNLHAELNPTSAGFLMPGCKLKIADADEDGIGEIWIAGDNVTAGYYKDPDATAASFEDGWFKTGDFGRVSDDGELFVCGRKKNLIVLDNGENIFPEDIEFSVMDNIPYVREVVALETVKKILDKEEKVIAAAIYVESSDFPEKSAEETEKIIRQDISLLNRKLPSYKKIQDVIVVYTPFEKNSTRKIIRQKVIDKYGIRSA